jgi:hypothetical protein
VSDFDPYIAVRGQDADGVREVMLVPAGMSTRDRFDHEIRRIRWAEELEALKQEWGVADARGDGLFDLPSRDDPGV